MRSDTVLAKTVRGREEITSRAHELTAMQRRLLILADGERTVGAMAEMLGRAQSDPVVMRDLKWLESGRYVDYAEEVHSVA
jgi:hypothetical protein